MRYLVAIFYLLMHVDARVTKDMFWCELIVNQVEINIYRLEKKYEDKKDGMSESDQFSLDINKYSICLYSFYFWSDEIDGKSIKNEIVHSFAERLKMGVLKYGNQSDIDDVFKIFEIKKRDPTKDWNEILKSFRDTNQYLPKTFENLKSFEDYKLYTQRFSKWIKDTK